VSTETVAEMFARHAEELDAVNPDGRPDAHADLLRDTAARMGHEPAPAFVAPKRAPLSGAETAARRDRVAAHLATAATAEEVAQALDMPRAHVHADLRVLRAAGRVVEVEHGTARRPSRYAAAPEETRS
jgi:biotin operon repressor